MAAKPDVLSVDQAEALLLGLLKTSHARKKQAADPPAAPGIIDNLISPPQVQAGPAGPKVTDPWWGAAQAGIAGAGAGGALGLGRALFDKERRKRWLQETLQGAILGGGIGGGAGLVGYGANRLLQHQGPPKPQAATRWQELGNRIRDEGILGGAGYVNEEVNNGLARTPLGRAPDSPGLAATGAIGGGIMGGSAGASVGRRSDLARMEYDANAPIRAHEANPGQRLHDLAVADPKAHAALNRPGTGGGASAFDRLNTVPQRDLPNVTHTRLGMAEPEFVAWRARANAHGRPAPLVQPSVPYMRRTIGGGIGGGILGALLGSQGLPRLLSPSNQGR